MAWHSQPRAARRRRTAALEPPPPLSGDWWPAPRRPLLAGAAISGSTTDWTRTGSWGRRRGSTNVPQDGRCAKEQALDPACLRGKPSATASVSSLRHRMDKEIARNWLPLLSTTVTRSEPRPQRLYVRWVIAVDDRLRRRVKEGILVRSCEHRILRRSHAPKPTHTPTSREVNRGSPRGSSTGNETRRGRTQPTT